MNVYKIIIIENDEDEQFFMRESFEKSGLFQILAMTRNGNELFDWLTRHPIVIPELFLSDLNMPGKNGYDIIEEVKAHPVYSGIPVVITSTSSTPAIINKCLDKGAADYLVKPDTFIEYDSYVKALYQRIEEKQLVK
jgi:CheY-like chemotaxis protein